MKYFVMKSVRSPLCLLKHVIEGKVEGRIEVIRQGRRRKQLLDDFKERIRYWKLKGEARTCRKTDDVMMMMMMVVVVVAVMMMMITTTTR
jgi:hypothetical protein